MTPVFRRVLFIILLPAGGITPFPAQAMDYAAELIQQARLQRLSAAPMWRALLHYQSNWLGGLTSTADDPEFFLAADGKTNPQSELEATLQAFFAASQTGARHP